MADLFDPDTERARRARRDALVIEQGGSSPLTTYRVLTAAVAAMREEADAWSASNRKGRVSTEANLRMAATWVAGLAESIKIAIKEEVNGTEATERPEGCSEAENDEPSTATSDAEAGEAEVKAGAPVAQDEPPSEPVMEVEMEDPFLPIAPIPARMGWSEIIAPRGMESPPFRSVSQVQQYSECGLRYRINRYHHTDKVTSWWNVGGSAFHSAIAEAELDGRNGPLPQIRQVGEAWQSHFEVAIEEAREGTSVPPSHWRAAARGTENEAWWRDEGPEMLARYLRWRSEWANDWQRLTVRMLNNDIVPVIETETVGTLGGVRVVGIIDQAYVSKDWRRIAIVDPKTGSSTPTDFQLKTYVELLCQHLTKYGYPNNQAEFSSAYYSARKGQLVGGLRPVGENDASEVHYRFATMDAAERNGVYLANPCDRTCGMCDFAKICPASVK